MNLKEVEARHQKTFNGFSSDPGAYVDSAADVPGLLIVLRNAFAILAGYDTVSSWDDFDFWNKRAEKLLAGVTDE